MEIWLNNGANNRIQLPINPESIGSDFSKNHEDIVLVSGDERTIISGVNLKTTTITSFIPVHNTYYQETGSIYEPMFYVNQIEKWMNTNAVIVLQITGTNINRRVTIRSFNWEEVGGAVGEISYTLELKEYKPITYDVVKNDALTSSLNPKPPQRPAPPKPQQSAKTYTVKKGDSLWKISQAYYGSGSKWPTIYNANKSVIGKNPNLIYPGQKLVIP